MNKNKWLNDSVFYNIYPQSFNDTNGDGIGDLNGITEKLDYIKEMGFNGIWLNPIYKSSFRDAGYDVIDFYKVDPRYGSNTDFEKLTMEAKKRGIKVVLDLVAGHTSLECEWFQQSAMPEHNQYSNRYIWTNSVWDTDDNNGQFICGYSDRDGCYMKNFFYCQPALNYGYKNVTKPWQLPMNHPDCLKTREELLKVMRFWSNLGADGFRVDMASSLIKGDPDGTGIAELWNDIRKVFDKEFPDSVLISEWSFPKAAINAGFDIDFLIHFNLKAYTTLFRYEIGTNQIDSWNGKSYFRKEGQGNINEFLDEYTEHYNAVSDRGYISIPSGNHDIPRISLGRDIDDLKVVYTFLLTMPGVPFIYYGDEIGMKYIQNLPSKEGGYNRTGSRTPMQWNNEKNFGFSESDFPYLPVDKDKDAPTVEKQLADKNSIIWHIKNIIKIRREHTALCADGNFEEIFVGYPFVYKRSDKNESVYIVLNPSSREINIELPEIGAVILNKNVDISADRKKCIVKKQAYLIYIENS